MLLTLVILLAATAIAVPLSRRAGFGSVLGYLLAGAIIGPSGLRLITDVNAIESISVLGVVMLLFLIGLELRPQRLWVMRRSVFGLGTAQIGATALVLAALALSWGTGWRPAAILGLGLALSSTAIVLPILGERDLLGTRAGRDSFAVLLFQDLAFIPIVALVPLLANGASPVPEWRHVGIGIGAVALILAGGRYLIRPAFRLLDGARVPEIFTTLGLLTVVGTAAIANAAGLSMSLGAFMAGVLLSDSEYRHELRADIEPFEGLLLGFFFISVGMSADISLIAEHPLPLILGALALLVTKAAVLFGLGRIAGQDRASATRFGLALPQGSEFSFVLFTTATFSGAMDADTARAANLVIALSMAATPLVFAASERFLIPRINTLKEPAYDPIGGADAPVIIAGFGRVGQVVGRLLRTQRIKFTALERDPGQVQVIRRFGTRVFYGDPARPELLRAAGAEQARLLIVAVEDIEHSLRIVEVARRHFPELKILARARNRRHAFLLMDRGITVIVRETFYSALRLGRSALIAMGVAEQSADEAVALFEQHDERVLSEQHAIYRDESQLIQSVQQAALELQDLFERDQPSLQASEGVAAE